MTIDSMVVMLPTKDILVNTILLKEDKTMTFFDQKFYDMYKFHQQFDNFAPTNATYQHLYLTSNEKIKEGDWIIKEGVDESLTQHGKPFKVHGISNDKLWTNPSYTLFDIKECHKIIACTDPSLKLPEIPQSFIQAYVASNGAIKQIRVEIRIDYLNISYEESSGITRYKQELKLNEKGEVIISYKSQQDENIISNNSDWNNSINSSSNHKKVVDKELEDAAKEASGGKSVGIGHFQQGFKAGAKWKEAQSQGWTDEDMVKC